MAVNTLISAAEAVQQGAQFVDCRFSLADPKAGRAEFEQHHIPGAVFADLEEDLSGAIIPGETGRHPLPNRNDLEATFRKLGITQHQPVIAYDANNGAFAARLWWLLRHLGHNQVWVLDGGYQAWLAADFESTEKIDKKAPSDFFATESLCQIIEADEIASTAYKLFDARDEARYRGEQEPIDPVAGHIPDAVCLPFANNLTTEATFKSPSELLVQFLEAGVDQNQPAICYCGSGVTACHNILAMRHAGLPEPILYPGSWSEWIVDPSRPIATG